MTVGDRIGLVLGSDIPPASIPEIAQLAERLGFGELWAPEDCFFNGGIAAAATALARTRTLRVGLGVVSGLGRHPAILAMELATLAGLYPGRIMPGIGLGAPVWVEQMGLTPRSQLAAVREATTAVKRLLAGETLDEAGETASFSQVALTHVPAEAPPIALGVIGPKMLRLSGEIADGTVLSVMATPAYVRWLRERVAEGQAAGGREGRPHRVTTFTLYRVHEDGEEARRQIRSVLAFYLFIAPKSALTDVYGIRDELLALHAEGGDDPLGHISRNLPDQWLEDLTVAGDPAECAEKIQRLLDAGSDAVCLWPAPSVDLAEQLELTASAVLGRLDVSVPAA